VIDTCSTCDATIVVAKGTSRKKRSAKLNCKARRTHSPGRHKASASPAARWRVTANVNPGTACPGANLYAHLTSGDLKRRIDELLVGGPVILNRICGPDADAIVTAIEAGH
jgi:hypothetical protein